MKQQEIAVIIIIAAISGVISYFASDYLFSSTAQTEQTVSKVDPITAEFNLPNSQYFNTESINPTQNIQTGNNNNQNPFNSGQ